MSDHSRPWFKFYPRDWLSDEKVRAISLTARGAYVEILSCMWKSSTGYLPNDEKRLQNMLGVSKEEFSEIWDELMPEDPQDRIFSIQKNRLFSKRLEKERKELIELSKMRSGYGKMGGRPKANEKQNESICFLKSKQTESKSKANGKQTTKQNKSHTDTDTDTETDSCKRTVSPDGAGGHFSDQITAIDLVNRIEQSGNLVIALSGNNGFKPFQWVQVQLKKYGNPIAITEALEATAKQYPRGFKKEPIAYCQGVFKKLNPKYNERESKAVSDGFKRIEPDEVLSGLLLSVGEKVV